MADYAIVMQRPDTEVVGGTTTREVQRVGVLTGGHGVYFETTLARAVATTANIRNQANGFTIVYELLFAIPGVTDVQWYENPTDSGQLQERFRVYVESSSGESSGVIDLPLVQLNQDVVAPKVAKLVAGLDATEG